MSTTILQEALTIMTKSTIPNEIFLQVFGGEAPELVGDNELLEEVSWCEKRVYEHDVKYVRADMQKPRHTEMLNDILSELGPKWKEVDGFEKAEGSLKQTTMKTGIELIAAERKRQIEGEGWTPEHDAQYTLNQLRRAADCYIKADLYKAGSPPTWPWHHSWWKPSPNDRVRELVKAGALIAAEIDRLQAKNH